MLKNYVAPILFLLCFCFSHSQKTSDNQYLPKDIEALEDYLEQINSDYIKRIDGSHASKIRKIFKNRDEKVLESINDSVYIFNDDINIYIDSILSNIYKANPQIDNTNYKFFVNTSFIPNASCYGDGMFEIYLGLFSTLSSDDEVAFVICHEIAHKLLDHPLDNVTNVISTINSKETKKKVREIKRQKYGQTRAALSVIDELSIDILDHSKETEAQADSLGFVLFSKTIYNKYKALSALSKLQRDDDMLLSHNIRVDSIFNFETYPFKPFWLKETVSIFDTDEKINEFSLDSDTLKTHPEIEFRIEKLKSDFSIISTDSSGQENNMRLLINLANLKMIESAIDKKNLDIAIYQLVELFHNKRIGSEYYHITMASVLKQIYNAKKNHELGKYIPPKSKFSDEKQLNKIRLFLHNLELGETKKMGLAFCKANKDDLMAEDNGTEIFKFFKSINQ
ncbi:M48 family metalloprotease [uncultured Winogradskyella sp.]|uniref:M48 family metalloprotease n=1 Tax=uncultured Winogradskyella sp. TaxID=395353 RepID=UPI00261D2650|nr:M48 family metalloprotease [uncultured Winogradskyella sp.]